MSTAARRASRSVVARSLAAGFLLIALEGMLTAAVAQQAGTARTDPDAATQCFAGTATDRIIAGCGTLLAAPRGTYTPEQTGLALQRRGGAFAASNRLDEALEDFRRMVTTGFRVHEAHASIGSIEYRRGRLAEAERSYREAIRSNGSYALAHSGLGHTLIQQGRAAEAIAHFDRALATNVDDASAQLGRGIALLASGNARDAVASFDVALRLQPGLLTARYQRAQAHALSGNTTAAIADADAAVTTATADEKVRALVFRGRLQNTLRNFAAATTDCTAADAEAQRLGSRDAGLRSAPFVCLAIAQQSRGQLAEAEASYRRALDWNTSDTQALSGRGYVLVQRGRYDEAIADFEATLGIDPRFQDALRFLGLAHSDKGDVPRALQAFERAIAADASDPWPVMIRAITYAREGDRQRALADAERALTLTGTSSSDAYLVRAAVHYFLEDLDRARTDLDTALRLSPANGQAHRLLARLLVRQGRLDDATRSLAEAERLMPGDVSVVFVRGLLALARRDYAAAIPSLDASLAINPAHAEGFAARGAAHEGLGNTARAIDDYRTAVGRLATDPESRAARSRATERLAALTAPQRPTPQIGPASAQGPPASQTAKSPQQSGPSSAVSTAPTGSSPPARPAGPVETSSTYCRLVEGVFVHSRRYTGVEFDVGCRTDR